MPPPPQIPPFWQLPCCRGVWAATVRASYFCTGFFWGEKRRRFGSRAAGRRAPRSGSPAPRLLGAAASCIPKRALSAGALGRNCHLLPHCQPRRGYASFADSQPPALITRLDSLPGATRPAPAHRVLQRGCAALPVGWGDTKWGRGTLCKPHPCPNPIVARGRCCQSPSAAEGCSRGPLLQHPTTCTPPGWFWGAAGKGEHTASPDPSSRRDGRRGVSGSASPWASPG